MIGMCPEMRPIERVTWSISPTWLAIHGGAAGKSA